MKGVLLSFQLFALCSREGHRWRPTEVRADELVAWRTSALPSTLLFFRSLLLSLPTHAHLQALFRERNESREKKFY